MPYLLTTIYSLPATGSMVDSSEYMVDKGLGFILWVYERERLLCISFRTIP